MPQSPADQWLTLNQAAVYASCSVRTLRRWVSIGELRAYRLNTKSVRVRRSDVDALLHEIPVG